jgi:Isochorismatase family
LLSHHRSLLLKLRQGEYKSAETDQWVDREFLCRMSTGDTALLICDMWDRHWCTHAGRRMNILAQQIEQTANVARAAGIQIIHSPSSTMPFYADYPERRRAQACPITIEPTARDWNAPPLSIDDEADSMNRGDDRVSRQNINISIEGDDIISDCGAEILNFLTWKAIDHLIFVGVHANKCILERTFGIKQMVRWGINCILIRNLTDVILSGTQSAARRTRAAEMTIQYVEQYWCPTALKQDLLAALH